jgi:glycosyltransferase 2 family protein
VSRHRLVSAAVGLLVGATALVISFFHLSLHRPFLTPRVALVDLASALHSARPSLFALFLLLNSSTLLLRGLQLSAIARRPDGTRPTLAASSRAVAVGILAHNLLPARLGEAARALVLARDGGVPLGGGVGALLVGRVFDLVALLLVACALPFALALDAARTPALHAVAGFGTGLAAALAALLAALHLGRHKIPQLFEKSAPRLSRTLRDFTGGLASLAEPRRLAPAALSSLAVPLLLAAANHAALAALAIDAPAGTAFALTGILTVGVAIPAAPSSLGTYHALVLLTLTTLGVPPAPALAWALATHLSTTLAGCLLGTAALGTTRFAIPKP